MDLLNEFRTKPWLVGLIILAGVIMVWAVLQNNQEMAVTNLGIPLTISGTAITGLIGFLPTFFKAAFGMAGAGGLSIGMGILGLAGSLLFLSPGAFFFLLALIVGVIAWFIGVTWLAVVIFGMMFLVLIFGGKRR